MAHLKKSPEFCDFDYVAIKTADSTHVIPHVWYDETCTVPVSKDEQFYASIPLP